MSINDLSSASKLLDPITFADYTNLFRSDYDGNTPLPNINKELQKINKELISNKLYLSVRKTTQVKLKKKLTKYVWFYQNCLSMITT